MNGQIEVELQEWMGSDVSIANAAWSSTYDKAKREDKYDDENKVKELVSRLAREGHSVPFESVVLRFWLRLPILVDRQHMTHRIASHNGLSGRYRTLPSDWSSVPDDVVEILNKVKSVTGNYVSARFNQLMQDQLDFYKFVLSDTKKAEHDKIITNSEYKRVREVVRGVIGTASMVERTTVMNLRSFANYQRLRNSEHAQKEIRLVAQKMLDAVREKNICPVAIMALENQGWMI